MANAKQVDFLAAGLLDSYGNPLSSGMVYTYEAGTTNAKVSYTASNKSAQATNPVILDAYGATTLYCDGNYKFVITTSTGVTVATFDNFIYSIPTTSGL